MARIVVINEVDPRELGAVLDKVLGNKPCPLNLGGIMTVEGGDMTSFLKSIGLEVNIPKQNPNPFSGEKNNKGGKQ